MWLCSHRTKIHVSVENDRLANCIGSIHLVKCATYSIQLLGTMAGSYTAIKTAPVTCGMVIMHFKQSCMLKDS